MNKNANTNGALVLTQPLVWYKHLAIAKALVTWACLFMLVSLVSNVATTTAYANQTKLNNGQQVFNQEHVAQGTKQIHQASANELATSPLASSSIIHLFLTLFFVIALILVAGFIARRFSGGFIANNEKLKTVATVSVGSREKIIVFQAGEKQLLLGVTANTISVLHDFPEPLIIESGNSTTSTDFKAQLARVMGRGA